MLALALGGQQELRQGTGKPVVCRRHDERLPGLV
jgi:hypothetical protein